MEGVAGTMAWLSHVPGCSRAGLYGYATVDFRFVRQLRLQRAFIWRIDLLRSKHGCGVPPTERGGASRVPVASF